ncbi:hypothetical protein Hdeb2414_s0343g00872491 [Helianthus debilis subsp. tardiflorus]
MFRGVLTVSDYLFSRVKYRSLKKIGPSSFFWTPSCNNLKTKVLKMSTKNEIIQTANYKIEQIE